MQHKRWAYIFKQSPFPATTPQRLITQLPPHLTNPFFYRICRNFIIFLIDKSIIIKHFIHDHYNSIKPLRTLRQRESSSATIPVVSTSSRPEPQCQFLSVHKYQLPPDPYAKTYQLRLSRLWSHRQLTNSKRWYKKKMDDKIFKRKTMMLNVAIRPFTSQMTRALEVVQRVRTNKV